MQLSFNIFKKCKISFSQNGSPNMQRHRCRKDKESISFLGRFHPGATTLQCLQNIGQRWVAKYVSVSAQNWRESGSVGLHGAVSCLQFRPHKVCNRHTAHFCAVQTCVACKLQPWVRCLGPTPAPSADEPSMRPLQKKMTISLRPFNCKLREDTSYNFDVFQEPMSETWDYLLCRLTPQHDLKKIGFWGKLPIIITVRLELIVLDAKKLDFINKKSALCTISAKFSIYGFTVWGLKANELLDLRGLQVTFMTSAALTSLFSSEICSKSSFSRLKFFEWLSVDERNIWEVQSMTTARKFQR